MSTLKLSRPASGSDVVAAMRVAAGKTGGRFQGVGGAGPCVHWGIKELPGFDPDNDGLEMYVAGRWGRDLGVERIYKHIMVGGILFSGQYSRAVDLERNEGARAVYRQFSKALEDALTN